MKMDSAASTGGHGKQMKYVSFPWPPVVAPHDRKTLAQAFHSSGSYWLYPNCPYTRDSVMSVRSQLSLQKLQKTTSYQNRFSYDSQ